MALLNEYAEVDEISPGQIRHTQHMKKIGYRQDGSLFAMMQDWEDSGDGTRPHKVDRAPLMVTAGQDGMRRIHPTREIDRYIELGAPFVKTGGVWGQVNLGSPTRIGHRLQWTRPNANMYIDFGGHFVKMSILLKGGFVPEDSQIAFPVGMSGFTRQGGQLLRDDVVVAQLSAPVMVDFADSTDIRVIDGQFVNIGGQAYWLMTLPDLTGMTQPVIDPTVTLQPDDSTGIDTYIVAESPTTNSDTDTTLYVGDHLSSAQLIRTLIKFDLSTIPSNAFFSSCILSLYCTADQSSNARTFRVFRLKRVWVENQVTWNVYSTGNAWQTVGGFGANDCEQTDVANRAMTASETLNVFKDFPFTPTTKDGIDLGNGWLIKADTELNDRYAFRSSTHTTAAERPKLTVIYTLLSAYPAAYTRRNRQRNSSLLRM